MDAARRGDNGRQEGVTQTVSQVMCALSLPSTFLAILVLSRNKRHIMESVKQVFTSNDPSWVDGAFFVRPLLGHWHICADALRHGVSYPTALLQAY